MNNLATGVAGDITHIIQTALAPDLSAVGHRVAAERLQHAAGRVSDHVAHITELLDASTDDEQKAVGLYTHLKRLSRRRLALDASVVFAGLAGAFTCAAAFTLFLVTLRDATDSLILIWVFGLALGIHDCIAGRHS